MYTRKELTRIFGNITYVISYGLKCEPKLVALTEDIPCQLFYFPKKAKNLLFCLYLDGVDLESIVLSILCVDPNEIDNIVPKNILGDDFNYRNPNIYVYTDCIPVHPGTVMTWLTEDILDVIKRNKKFYTYMKRVLKANKQYEKFRQLFEFVPNSIDIRIK